MLTQDSVPFLFDLRLIWVWFLSDPCSIFIQFPFSPRLISRPTPVNSPPVFQFISLQLPIPSAIFFLETSLFLPETLLLLPFSANTLFPLPDKFPLYNIIMCPFPSPTFSFPIINYQNRPLPQPFTFLSKIFSKKSPFIFVSYHIIPYFCIRFPRDGQHLILTCCNGVGSALQNNKNNFLFIWIIIIKVVIFAVRFAERGPLAVFSFPFAQRGLEIKDGHWEKNFPKHLAV